MATEFATLDLETTGLSPKRDRVIEIGIIRTSESGETISTFSSLINCGRDVGKTEIHGIEAWMLQDAPTFSEIAGDVARILNGAILVAHNARFDAQFLDVELERAGRGRSDIDALCTLELMFAGYPDGPRRLGDCCKALDIQLRPAHDAFNDAAMTSELLHHLLKRVSVHVFPEPIWIEENPKAGRVSLPRGEASNPRLHESTYLSALVHRLSANGDTGLTSAVSVAQYLNLLDQVLEDRKIDSEEADVLFEFAIASGLSQDRVAGLHAAFVANLCAIAAADGDVTPLERRDIEQVANLLAINDWEELLIPSTTRRRALPSKESGLSPGVSVCFTGEMSVSRPELERRSVEAGLTLKGGVSKKLDLLVVADADSMSGKARKARELHIRIVSEPVFLRMLSNAEI